VNVFNDLRLSTVDSLGCPVTAFRLTVEGEGSAELPTGAGNLVVAGARLAFLEAGFSGGGAPGGCSGWEGFPPVHFHLTNRIPIGAGLGSSSAAIVAGLLAGLALTGHALAVGGEERLLQLAAGVEGHVDNLAPCLYGGAQIGVHTAPPGGGGGGGGRWYTTVLATPPGLQCVLFIPHARQSTEGARAVLPASVPRADAVFNIGRVALLVNALATGHLGDLRLACEDALHQPARAALMPALAPAIAAALAAGAAAAFLSGAGSAVMAFTTGRKGDVFGQRAEERTDAAVARAMALAARGVGVPGRVLITQPTAMGAHVIEVDGDASAAISGSAAHFELPLGSDELAVLGTALPPPLPPAAVVPPPPAAGAQPHLSSSPAASAWEASRGGAASVRYLSTRGGGSVGFAAAVLAGLAPDGGLYVPERLPLLPPALLASWRGLSYAHVAARVFSLFVGEDELPFSELEALCGGAYGLGGVGGSAPTWDTPEVAPVVAIPFEPLCGGAEGTAGCGRLFVAEHFHGPTCAFKDLALQLLGRLFAHLLARQAAGGGGGRGDVAAALPTKLTVLGATSGDTGSAALAGLRGLPRLSAVILHPEGRVARVQALQMTTVLDANVHNVAVAGASFDDCQAAVKAAFTNGAFAAKHSLVAVNSINWARVLAQTAYHVWTYLRWLDARGASTPGGGSEPPALTLVVPTGNFGNALSAHYARALGVPLRVHVATNANDAMHRFISGRDGGVGGSARAAPTLAPSMDITAASNVERFIYHAAAGDGAAGIGSGGCGDAAAGAAAVRRWAAREAALPPAVFDAAAAAFTSSAADDAAIDRTIARALRDSGYALCPHTACAVFAVDTVPALAAAARAGALVVCATAHPAKFAAGTPALARAGLYFAEVEGEGTAPCAPLCARAAAEAAAAFQRNGGVGGPRPALPQQLRGLWDRPTRCARLQGGTGLERRVADFVDAIATVSGGVLGGV